MRAYDWVIPGTKVFLYCELQSGGTGHVNSHEKHGNHLPLLFSIVLLNFVFRWPSCEREWAKGFSASFCFREFTGLKAELLGSCNSWKVCTDIVLLRDGHQTCLLTEQSAIRHECLCANFPGDQVDGGAGSISLFRCSFNTANPSETGELLCRRPYHRALHFWSLGVSGVSFFLYFASHIMALRENISMSWPRSVFFFLFLNFGFFIYVYCLS